MRELLIVVAWIVLALSAYQFQLSGGWRFDDGHHLAFLIQYNHFEYIYDPGAARLQSGAHYTPFNILTYDLAHRLVPFTKPVWFYAFHIALIGLATATLHLYLRLITGWIAATCGAAVFLLGFPITGMSGQLMVGHYVIGFGFGGLCLYCYERGARDNRFYPLAVGLYFLACLCKEIFLPLILFPALDPRFGLRQRIRRTLPWLGAATLFWLLRTLVVANAVGGYNDGLPVRPLAALEAIVAGLHAYATMSTGAVIMSLLLAFCCVLTFATLWRRFDLPAATTISAAAIAGTMLPLTPVALQVSPHAPTEIRLLSGIWFMLSIAAAVALSSVSIRNTSPLRPFMASTMVLATVWASISYVRNAPLFPLGHEFDNVTRHLIERDTCYLHDKYGWSSWLYDLNRAMWPQSPPPLMAPLEILDTVGKPGHPICEFNSEGVRATGKVEATSGCVSDEELSVELAYNGSHLVMNFGPDRGSVYYVEVPDAYFLKLPASFTMPYPDRQRLKDFRLLKINSDGVVACSPVLHFDPAVQPYMQWSSAVSADALGL